MNEADVYLFEYSRKYDNTLTSESKGTQNNNQYSPFILNILINIIIVFSHIVHTLHQKDNYSLATVSTGLEE